MGAAVPRPVGLLPSERVLWQGGPRLGTPRDLRYTIVPLLLGSLAVVTGLFAGLLYVAHIPAVRPTAFTAFYFLMTAFVVRQLPRYWYDSCKYVVTDRRVLWQRGTQQRSMDRASITFARIHWHRSEPGVGHLELVRAVPFGPLSRRQRLVLNDIEAPDVVFSLIRNTQPNEFAGYADVKLTDRLDRGETVLWGAGPVGWRLGQAELMTAAVGVFVLLGGLFYAYKTTGILVGLEHVGLPVRSWTWAMLFGAIAISASVIFITGAALLWRGVWGARADGSSSEYVLTESRLIIRRGRVELSVDRRRIVDIADLPSSAGSRNLHLILDAPDARALDASGALGFLPPPRGIVAPVLYEVVDLELLRSLLLTRKSGPRPPVDRAA